MSSSCYLKLDGILVATEGSYDKIKHPTKVGWVTVPGKPKDDLAIGALNSALRQARMKKKGERDYAICNRDRKSGEQLRSLCS
ncbi:MAG: type II toxin-antitoxin system HicA family toxin [Acidobacteriota bacterium]